MARSNDAPKKVLAVVGVVGTDPEEGETPNGDPVVNFRLAVTTSYEEGAESRWFDVAVWNEGLIDSVLDEIGRGSKVAVEGTYSKREYDGKTYEKINASKVGVVEFLSRSKSSGSSTKKAAPSRRSRDEDDDEDERPTRRQASRSSSRSTGRSTSRRAAQDDTEDDDLPW